ncbi:D-glycero-beta-D-manno-heptose 1,7-bisphosphate 7-phosphatase [Arcobacter peruensis]|uniref:D-glycero-beta-D-manno-heptose 1,7-bisphosphate 7-phosphatase n=1 Tax=Arcobacter peruensis TaxID=2320140 RepID=UPI000F07E919|nr:D-glycero-beta-D-manno-heptose 1,7-bisphosphate 7-phosphatase [Arcobacter peruensis]
MTRQKIVFLDRDGVINIDKHYVYKIEDFEFINNIFDTCIYFQKLGYKIIIVTNQSGIGRKYFSQSDFDKLSEWMIKEFKNNKIEILDVFFCPHTPNDNCFCRKPKHGMITQACQKYDIDLNTSWMIGDKISDIDMAFNAGIKNSILISSQYSYNIDDLKTKNIIEDIIETKNIIKA